MRIAQASINNIPAVVASLDSNAGWIRLAGYADLSAVLLMEQAELAKG